MKIVSVIGARPQFIKLSPVDEAGREAGHEHVIVHTGQHYDDVMSAVFFRDMEIPTPDFYLEVGSGSHGRQTGLMLMRVEEVLLDVNPDWVVVYGDTNTTLAGALAACKLRIPLAHVEAGLRSFNREMPEEHNRILTDHCSDLLFCPTQNAVENLEKEGLVRGVHWVGDTMYDAILRFKERALKSSRILEDLGLTPKSYLLATIHRPYNTDTPENLTALLEAFAALSEPVIFPVHPRTRRKIDELPMDAAAMECLKMLEPVGYLDMLALQMNSRMILTDSGGIQKEAYFLQIPCVTLRPETEWIETVRAGWNVLVGTDKKKIIEAVRNHGAAPPPPTSLLFGDGRAADAILRWLESSTGRQGAFTVSA